MKFSSDLVKSYLETYGAQIRGWLSRVRNGPVESVVIERGNGMSDAVCAAELAGFCRARRMTSGAPLSAKDRWEWTITPEGRSWMEL